MRYGERLRLARRTALGEKISQAKLAERARIDQSLISQLENSQTATGSQYTNRLAKVLGISADWLADEEGEMKPNLYSTSDPTLVELLKALEPRPEYLKETALKAVANTLDAVDHGQVSDGAKPQSDAIKTHRTPDSKHPILFYGGIERRQGKKNADEK